MASITSIDVPAATKYVPRVVVSEQSRSSYSNTLSTLIVLGSVLFFAAYLCFLIITYRYARNHPRGLNKQSGARLQRYAPGKSFYMFIVTSSLVEVSLASWLLIQYFYFHNSPNRQAYVATQLLVFCACWTAVTAGTYSVLFLHPRWTELPVASIGAQLIWVFVTWLLWITGAGLLNGAVPALLVKGRCLNFVYCRQIQGLFALAVIETLTLTTGMGILVWLAWSSTSTIRLPQRLRESIISH